MLAKTSRCLLVLSLFASTLVLGDQAHGTFVNDPNLSVDVFLQNTLSSGNSYGDVAIGPGGHFGDDVYVTEFGFFTSGDGTGRVLRLADANDDGVAEVSVAASAVGTGLTSPAGIAFGPSPGSSFGHDMYVLDYPSSTARRFVYRVSNSPAQTVSQFSTSSIFNPNSLRLSPEGGRLLINAAQNFTVFGGGADGRVFEVSPAGGVTTWASGGNDTNGFWDINNTPGISPDGWYTFSNHSIGPSNPRKLIQLQDLNADGDADDPGELRELIPLGAPVNQQSGFGFDALGRLYHSTGDDIIRYSDLNNDGDYWDTVAGDFDPGEQELFAGDFGAAPLAFAFNDRGDLFFTVNVAQGSSVQSTVYRIAGAGIPEPSASLLLLVGLAAPAARRRMGR